MLPQGGSRAGPFQGVPPTTVSISAGGDRTRKSDFELNFEWRKRLKPSVCICFHNLLFYMSISHNEQGHTVERSATAGS